MNTGLFAAIALVVAPTAVPPGLSWQPAGRWVLQVEPGGCLLQREFAGAGGRVTFGVRRLPLSGSAELFLVSQQSLGAAGAAGVRYGGWQWEGRFTSAALASGNWLASATLPRAELDSVDGTAELAVTFGSFGAILTQAHLAAALAAERSCETKVLEAWGVDPAVQARVATPVVSLRPETWVTPGDYPVHAMQNGIAGRVIVVWTVDAAGNAADCRVVASSGSRDLDDVSCRLVLTRGRFRPALDRDGHPVASQAVHKFNWVLPHD